MNQSLLNSVLNYENETFNKFIESRNKFVEIIKKIEINKLDNTQLLIFINDTKAVIDPVLVSIQNMEHFSNNLNFLNNSSVLDQIELQKMIFSYFLLRNSGSGSELDE